LLSLATKEPDATAGLTLRSLRSARKGRGLIFIALLLKLELSLPQYLRSGHYFFSKNSRDSAKDLLGRTWLLRIVKDSFPDSLGLWPKIPAIEEAQVVGQRLITYPGVILIETSHGFVEPLLEDIPRRVR
jgi:hypothetical protein